MFFSKQLKLLICLIWKFWFISGHQSVIVLIIDNLCKCIFIWMNKYVKYEHNMCWIMCVETQCSLRWDKTQVSFKLLFRAAQINTCLQLIFLPLSRVKESIPYSCRTHKLDLMLAAFRNLVVPGTSICSGKLSSSVCSEVCAECQFFFTVPGYKYLLYGICCWAV